MSTSREDLKNLRALESLSAAAPHEEAPWPKQARVPPLPQHGPAPTIERQPPIVETPPQIHAPPSGSGMPLSASAKAPAGPSSRHYRCLSCGYRLIWESGLQCSECGKHWDRAALERWFDGVEKLRFERIAWLVKVVLVALGVSLLALFDERFASLGLVWPLVAAYAMWVAVRGRLDRQSSDFASVGLVCALIAAGNYLRPTASLLNYSEHFQVNWLFAIVIGYLMLLAMTGDRELVGASASRLVGLVVLCMAAIPIVFDLAPISLSAMGSRTVSALALSIFTLLLSAAMWGLVWLRVARVHFLLFGESRA
ncbi:MAG: hypothetical protein U1D55_17120 [Phycisphaerae bacterium]